MSESQYSILGISFDGLAISGVVNELLNVAAVLRDDRFRVLVDLGYDITMRTSADSQCSSFPRWVELISSIGTAHPRGYCKDIVSEARSRVIAGSSIAAAKIYDGLCDQIAELLVTTFLRENVRILIVENGTLPNNPLFTEAIYLAIAEYGARQKLRKYVLWRDHDLMWSAEPHLFGSYPYPGVRKPEPNEHVHYAVLTEWMRKRLQTWAPSVTCYVMPNRFFSSAMRTTPSALRAEYGIPDDAYLVARCTRVVPQKSIERDLRLLDQLQQRLAVLGDPRRLFLFVTGPTQEDPVEFERLHSLAQTIAIAGQVVWGDGLLPFSPLMIDQAAHAARFSIRDLLAESDLSSFLTTYDYEGFGNPPGESMAMGVPFISTTYELYEEVYGSKGAIAPLLPIDRASLPEAPIPDSFVNWTLQTLTDPGYRAQITARNLDVCRRFFSLDALERQMKEMFASALN